MCSMVWPTSRNDLYSILGISKMPWILLPQTPILSLFCNMHHFPPQNPAYYAAKPWVLNGNMQGFARQKHSFHFAKTRVLKFGERGLNKYAALHTYLILSNNNNSNTKRSGPCHIFSTVPTFLRLPFSFVFTLCIEHYAALFLVQVLHSFVLTILATGWRPKST